MNRIFAGLLSLLLASNVLASTTWSDAATGSQSVKAVCTATTETLTQPSGTWASGTTYAAGDVVLYANTPFVSLQADNVGNIPSVAASVSWWRAVGVSISRATTLLVTVEATTGHYISDGNGFDLYVFTPLVGKWAKFNSTPYTVPQFAALAGSSPSVMQGDSPGIGIPLLFRGNYVRVAVVPTGAGADSGAITIWHLVMDSTGSVL